MALFFSDLLDQYFFQPGDEGLDSPPLSYDGCLATPLIDGHAYNAAIENAINQVGNEADNSEHFIFIANWWLGLLDGEVEQDGPLGPQVDENDAYLINHEDGTRLLDLLKLKADLGVEVRVMAWVNDAMMSNDTVRMAADASMTTVNSLSMQSIKALRAISSIGNRAILNLVSHSGGGVHMKMVLIGNDTQYWGFTGGFDFEMSRFDNPDHVTQNAWHDVAVQLEGPVVQAFYDHYRFVYNENLGRKATTFKFEGGKLHSYETGTPKIKARATPAITPGSIHVQSLRTIPRFLYKKPNCVKEIPAPAAFPDGLFEFRCALKKAIDNADRYIYMEDQSFWSKEVMQWINARIKVNSDLNVIFLTSGAPDPNDPDFDEHQIWTDAFNHGLLEGLSADQINQIRFFRKWSVSFGKPKKEIINAVISDNADEFQVLIEREATKDAEIDYLKGFSLYLGFDGVSFPVSGNDAMSVGEKINIILEKPGPGLSIPAAGDEISLFRMEGITVHSKTVIIDDNWACIGSANQMRRSLYTDWEHSVAIMDENDLFVREYRKVLWNEHFTHNNPQDFDDIEGALHAWSADWGVPGTAPPLPVRPLLDIKPDILDEVSLPYSPHTEWISADKTKHDVFNDMDSRVPWNGLG
jgi:phosphatidylserine/phosphatidylglycerophosphate/cardiolipin synthase-like enzyme